MQAAENIQLQRFSNNGSSDIVCHVSARTHHRIMKLARMIAAVAGCENIQSAHLMEALHSSQPYKVDDELIFVGQTFAHTLRMFLF